MRRLAVIGILVLAGCASSPALVILPSTTPGDQAQARARPAGPARPIELNQSFDQFQAESQRVADIAFRLASANVELCPDRSALSGLTLHTLAEYSQEYAATLTDHFPTPQPGVLNVAASSPAATVGLRADDLLMAVNGKPFAAAPAGAHPTTERTDAAAALLNDALASGQPSTLRINRGGRELDVTIPSVPGCAYRASLAVASSLQPLVGWLLLPPRSSRGAPSSSGGPGNVVISERMVSYARDDNELAFVIGHEYAHNLLHHPANVGPAGEAEADYLGLYLAARAGYDISNIASFWIQLSHDYPEEPLAHSSATTRIARLAATRREIDAKRAAGQPLVPNFTALRIPPSP